MPETTAAKTHEHVPCPFCGLLCDDLRVVLEAGGPRLDSPACPTAEAAFERSRRPGKTAPEIGGRHVTPDAAYARAAELLSNARHALIGGLGADVSGIREALALGDRLGATLEHMDAATSLRNLHVLQHAGWMTTTLAELKNRADFVLILGEAIPRRYPRLFERYIRPAESLFPERLEDREVWILGGPAHPDETASAAPRCEYLPCPMHGLGEVAAALRTLLGGRPLQAPSIHGLSRETLESIAERLRRAEYGVVVWTPAEFDFDHAELAVEAVAELVRDLNETTRCSGLSLGGENGGTTSYQVCAWQTGFPVRMSFRHGYPDYDPYHYAAARMLEHGEADALLWISAFDPERLPPEIRARGPVASIVLGHPHMDLPHPPDVFIPVATPGIDHAGALFRCDGVVSLPLRKLREAETPSAGEALHAIAAHLS